LSKAQRQIDYRKSHPERASEQSRRYYQNNRAKRLAQQNAWRARQAEQQVVRVSVPGWGARVTP